MSNNVGSGGAVERFILFVAGCIMGAMGGGLLYFAYRMVQDGKHWNYEELYLAGCIGLAFFLLRGAWFTAIPEKKEVQIKMTHDR